MRAPVETMIKSNRWCSEEPIATTKLDHLDHHRVICMPVHSKVQVPED